MEVSGGKDCARAQTEAAAAAASFGWLNISAICAPVLAVSASQLKRARELADGRKVFSLSLHANAPNSSSQIGAPVGIDYQYYYYSIGGRCVTNGYDSLLRVSERPTKAQVRYRSGSSRRQIRSKYRNSEYFHCNGRVSLRARAVLATTLSNALQCSLTPFVCSIRADIARERHFSQLTFTFERARASCATTQWSVATALK